MPGSDSTKPALPERTLLRGRVQPFAFGGALLWAAFLLWPGALIKLATMRLKLTDQRLVGSVGLFPPRHVAWRHKDIEQLLVQRSPLGHLFGYGTLVVRHRDGSRMKFPGVAGIVVFHAELEEALEVAQLGRSLRQAEQGDTLRF